MPFLEKGGGGNEPTMSAMGICVKKANERAEFNRGRGFADTLANTKGKRHESGKKINNKQENRHQISHLSSGSKYKQKKNWGEERGKKKKKKKRDKGDQKKAQLFNRMLPEEQVW